MPGIKMTYGKRSKKTTAFCSMTDLFTSPTDQLTGPKLAKATDDALEYCAQTLEEASQTRGGSKGERQQRALQPMDSNVSCSPFRRPKANRNLVPKPIEDKAIRASSSPKASGKQTPGTSQKEAQSPGLHTRSHLKPINKQRNFNLAKTPKKSARSTAKSQSSDSKKPPSMTTGTSEPKAIKPGRSKSPRVLVPKPRRPDPLADHTRGLLRLCSQPDVGSAPRQFSTWAASLEPQFHVIKIAEASYGEVYRLALKKEFSGFSKSDESVFKMIALKPPTVNRPQGEQNTENDEELEERIENMSSVESVLGEVKLLRRMSEVPGFTNFREIHVLQGAPSEPFVKAWRDWNDARPEEKKSIFPDPGVEGSYDATQLWAVVEMQDAGDDLEQRSMEAIGGVFGIWDIFWGVALALGKGEEDAHFEHRDLHMGNICIRPIDSNKPIAAPSSAPELARKLNFTGLETTLIDYTLSRAQMTSPLQHPEPELSEIAYEDLELQDYLFEADSSDHYQYEIYRYMRGAMFLDDPLADVDARDDEAMAKGRTWAGFHPQTNLVWLHFVLHEMMLQLVPVKKNNRSKSKGRTTRKKGAVKDNASFDRLLVEKKQELEKILNKLQKLLDPECVAASGVWSTKGLISLAVHEGWLDEKDVIVGDDDDVGKSLIEVVEELDAETHRAASPVTQTAELLRTSRL